jgi:hypothetical protein
VTRRRITAGAVFAVLGTVLFVGGVAGAMDKVQVTPDGTAYRIHSSAGIVTVTAPRTTGGNNREFFWTPKKPAEASITVCATFGSGEGIDQQGVVLRLNHAYGDTTGITVTRNIYFSVFNFFNFHVWNTDADPSVPYTQFGSVGLTWLPKGPALYPINLCARSVTATNEVQFIVWTPGQSRPPWGSTTSGGEATIPKNAPRWGQGGFFAGHLVAGTSMTYKNLTVNGATPAGL